MLIQNKFLKNINLAFFQVFCALVCFFVPFSVLASCEIKLKPGGSVNLKDIAECAEERYGFDEDVLRNNRQNNPQVPEVQVYFDNTSPKEGEEVTAVAAPMNFKNPPENLYYTWYLVHTNEKGDPVDVDGSCGNMTLNVAKIEAAKIMARGDYDGEFFGVDYGALKSDPNYQDDNDGMILPMGGIGGSSKAINHDDYRERGGFTTPCMNYRQPESFYYIDGDKQILDTRFNTGVFQRLYLVKSLKISEEYIGQDFILPAKHEFAIVSSRSTMLVGDGKFELEEEEYWGTDPYSADTDGDGVVDEADVAGLNQQKFTWKYRKGDRVGVIVEGTSNVPLRENALGFEGDAVGDINSNYKIMFAKPGVCDMQSSLNDYAKDFNYLEGDGCASKTPFQERFFQRMRICGKFKRLIDSLKIYRPDCAVPVGAYDFGFQYAKSIPVNANVSKPVEAEINLSPSNPQYFKNEDFKLTDWVTAKAALTDESSEFINKDFVYYAWSFEKCSSFNDESSCLSIPDDDIEIKSHKEGLATSSITFRPTENFAKNFSTNSNTFIKVILKTQRCKSDPLTGITSAISSYSNNPLSLKIYKTSYDTDRHRWSKASDEICSSGLSRHLCPVSSGQVLYVEASVSDASKEDFSYQWSVDGEEMETPLMKIDEYSGDSCDDMLDGGYSCESDSIKNIIYLPIKDGDNSEMSIGVIAKKKVVNSEVSAERLVSGKIFSVRTPQLIISNDESASDAVAYEYEDENSEIIKPKDVYLVENGGSVKFNFDEGLLPQYLMNSWEKSSFDPYVFVNKEEGLTVNWTFNGENIDEDFEAKHDELNLKLTDSSSIEFDLVGSAGAQIVLGLNLVKNYSDDYSFDFRKLWKGNIDKSLQSQSEVVLKVEVNPEEEGLSFLNPSKFMASTVKSASSYLKYSIRLSMALLLVFSSVYFVGNIKKND